MRSFWRYSWITAQTSGRCCCTETGRPRRAQVSLGIAVREMEPLAGETVEVRREGIAEKCTGSGAVPGAVRGKGWQQIGGKRKRKRAERATHQRDKPRLGSATGGKAKSSRLLVFSQHGKTQPTHAATVEAVLTLSRRGSNPNLAHSLGNSSPRGPKPAPATWKERHLGVLGTSARRKPGRIRRRPSVRRGQDSTERGLRKNTQGSTPRGQLCARGRWLAAGIRGVAG
jgi:hypothetical protein